MTENFDQRVSPKTIYNYLQSETSTKTSCENDFKLVSQINFIPMKISDRRIINSRNECPIYIQK